MKKLPLAWRVALLAFSLWACAALCLDSPAAWLGGLAGFLYLAAALAAFRHRGRPRWLGLAAWTILNGLVLTWWLSLRPTNNRPWQTDVSRLPWAEIGERQVVIHEIRDFDYRTEKDYTPRWETRVV